MEENLKRKQTNKKVADYLQYTHKGFRAGVPIKEKDILLELAKKGILDISYNDRDKLINASSHHFVKNIKQRFLKTYPWVTRYQKDEKDKRGRPVKPFYWKFNSDSYQKWYYGTIKDSELRAAMIKADTIIQKAKLKKTFGDKKKDFSYNKFMIATRIEQLSYGEKNQKILDKINEMLKSR